MPCVLLPECLDHAHQHLLVITIEYPLITFGLAINLCIFLNISQSMNEYPYVLNNNLLLRN